MKDWKVSESVTLEIVDGSGYRIAKVYPYAAYREKANANLISTAPKLDRYREYVDTKIDIGKIPLRYNEFEEGN